MNGQRLVFVLLLCLIAGSNSQGPVCSDPNQNLVNTVVYEGDSSSFFNQLDPSGITWQIAPSNDPSNEPNPPYIVADYGITPYPDVYAVTPTQLSISTTSIYPQSSDPYSSSGLYMATYKTDGCQSLANLIVVSQGPVCQCCATDSDNAVLSCKLNYGVAHILPNYATMTWSTDSGQVYSETPAPEQTNPVYDVSTSSYSVTSLGAATYTCGVTFTAPDPGAFPNMATNAPTFYASCTIPNCVKPTATT